MSSLRTGLGRVARGAGAAEVPARAHAFTALLVVLAVVATMVGLLWPAHIPAGDPLPPIARFGIACGVMALAQLASLRLRIGSGRLSVTWGEAALIIGLYAAPSGWLPAATFAAALAAWLLLATFAKLRTPLEVVHIAASQTVAVAAAVTVACRLADPIGAPLTPPLAGALVLGALTYLLVGALLAVCYLRLVHGVPVFATLVRALHDKLLMFIGNVVVGLATVAMVDSDPRWLLLLPPVLWLLQQTYGHRLRAADERRAWEEFAGATSALKKLDEDEVAVAGVAGALRLLVAERVDLDVVRMNGSWRRYHADADGGNGVTDLDERPATGGDESTLVRELTVRGQLVGQIRVALPRPTLPSARDEFALRSFGDTLAVALHDAVTHRAWSLLQERSSYDAVHDAQTGLLNRAAVVAQGDAALRRLGRDHPVALVVVDIDRFRTVNDTLGHAAGDELLAATATRMKALTGQGELLGRLGGDQFALLIAGAERMTTSRALDRAAELIEAVAATTEVQGIQLAVEASAGVVVAVPGSANVAELLRRADIALRQAKEGGGGNTACYDPSRDESSTDQLTLLSELREALEAEDQLVLALQPAVDLTTGAPTGVEALIRWRHPRRGVLKPGDFVRAAEESDLLGAFTLYVIDRALRVAADVAAHGMDVPIAVNLSAHNLLDQHLPSDVNELLRRHGVSPDRLVLEITETVVMSDQEVIDEVLAGLRQLGVRIALDDFGTGYSSLAFLARVPVDEVKVDRSFVMRMAESPQAAAIVRFTIGLGQELGLRVVAEGVETAAQRAALENLGCGAAQGYHFFKPMPADKIVAVLSQLTDSARAQVFPLRADGSA
ncbi:bifunctional diguanylate cyclase/phosphodiesterase [Asanoa sp. WMMD1127]|uniref:putative bifunctional diguanylate cyclase/phosphodiesterase n=1 Tax=Asanoa sp. WMMD1127 TaxID=3016107 RepID=UPI002417E2C5|nr:bifunctional diguanylate cyclase/phosphodiesterase [Asanoa sp. WMMD1127]MDG4820973.1 bifunctional diguanylate cyclase/phosphodiesterase [Asanoa sp. WMMD1127]